MSTLLKNNTKECDVYENLSQHGIVKVDESVKFY